MLESSTVVGQVEPVSRAPKLCGRARLRLRPRATGPGQPGPGLALCARPIRIPQPLCYRSPVPPTLGRYELLKRIAGGGMGEVYLARQRGAARFEKLLVIKTLLPHLCEDEEFINMFQDEARISAQLIHPNICQTLEFDQADNTWFIAMEYLRGEDVRRVWKAAALKGLTIPVPLICRIISDAASGLDFAHALTDPNGQPYGIVHRDISPQNILVTFEGGVKIIDFGVAKAAGRLTQTRTGALKGKYSYMSPEQVSGQEIDQRTDIFALGIVLHELLTAMRLFKSDSDVSTIERVKKSPIPAPSELNPSLPKGLDPIVLKALDRDVSKRYQTAQEFRLAIEDWLVQERMSASSAHLAEFLKKVYRERLELEARHGPLLGEAAPQAVPIGAHRPSSSNLGRLEQQRAAPAAGGMPFPFEAVKGSKTDKEEPTRNERDKETPSKGTSKIDEPSKKSVIDLSELHTEQSQGPFKGRPALKYGVTGLAAAAIVGFAIWILSSSRSPAPAPAPKEPVATTAVEPPKTVEAAPAPAQPQFFAVLVKSDPEGAEVSDGARILGTTPFNWRVGKGAIHTLTFRMAGYREEQLHVTISAEQDLAVRLRKLEPRSGGHAKKAAAPAPTAAETIKLER